MHRRKVIALLMNTEGLRDDYQGGLRRGVEHACVEYDADLWVFSVRADQRPRDFSVERLLDVLGPDRIDGVIVATGCIASWTPAEVALEHLRLKGLTSLCSVGHTCANLPNMVVDNFGGAAALVDHLVEEHARRRFVYIGGPVGHEEAEERLRGVTESLKRHGLDIEPGGLIRGDWTVAAGSDALQEFIRKKIPFDAVLAGNDDMALGAIAVLRAVGYRCPEDVSVVGFDDAAAARFSHPPLTTASQPLARLGMLAVKRLMDSWVNDFPSGPLILDTELILRESCGCHPTHHLRTRDTTPARARTRRSPQEEIRELLRPIFDVEKQRDRYAGELVEAAAAEARGKLGTLIRVLNSMIMRIPHPHVPLYELQRIVTCLRDSVVEQGITPSIEEAFHAARVLVGSHAHRREGETRLRNEYLLEELRLSWERLATCLSLPDLSRALASELPRFGILNAAITLFAPGSVSELVLLVSVKDGVSQRVSDRPYPASLLLPEAAIDYEKRRSLTILPLTFESEFLGVAVIELPQGLEAYTLLREQIGSAVKAAALHQEILATERLHAQAQEERRVTAERLRSLSLIAGGVAHDLNNALGPLVALPETILRDLVQAAATAVPAEVREDLEMISMAGQRAALTIRDLLALGKPPDIPQGAVELNRVLAREKSSLLALCEREPQMALEVEFCPEPLTVLIDKTHLLRAITNLVINAIDAMDSQGTVRVHVRRQRVEQPLDGIESVDPGTYAVIDVEDTGHGIAEEHLPRILEPFYTTKQHPGTSGTGLGLAIVHRIVKDASGFLQIRSKVGEGTTFSVYLPLQREVESPQSRRPEPIVGGSERILVVDDEQVQLRTARRILEQLGYTVTTVTSGKAAIQHVRDLGPRSQYDLVLVDMVMPGELNGIETIDRLREIRADQRVVIASGYAPDQMDATAADRGLPWLAKPYTPAKLAGLVRSTLDGKLPARIPSTSPVD
jgi:DNA-binding LacI/PurR family transcriptional regulator/signal transduction histidine kinase/ActR/RegA family two-component response regulator